MEVLHREIGSFELEYLSVSRYFALYKEIYPNKTMWQLGNCTPMIEIFGKNVWDIIKSTGLPMSEKIYKFSPGKMDKSLIKLYLKEYPVNYVILEVISPKPPKYIEELDELIPQGELRGFSSREVSTRYSVVNYSVIKIENQ